MIDTAHKASADEYIDGMIQAALSLKWFEPAYNAPSVVPEAFYQDYHHLYQTIMNWFATTPVTGGNISEANKAKADGAYRVIFNARVNPAIREAEEQAAREQAARDQAAREQAAQAQAARDQAAREQAAREQAARDQAAREQAAQAQAAQAQAAREQAAREQAAREQAATAAEAKINSLQITDNSAALATALQQKPAGKGKVDEIGKRAMQVYLADQLNKKAPLDKGIEPMIQAQIQDTSSGWASYDIKWLMTSSRKKSPAEAAQHCLDTYKGSAYEVFLTYNFQEYAALMLTVPDSRGNLKHICAMMFSNYTGD